MRMASRWRALLSPEPDPYPSERQGFVTTTSIIRSLRVGLALAIMLTIGAAAGCNSKSGASSTTKTKPADTTKVTGAASVALSSVTTAAPDGKILLGQIVSPIATTATPMWEFLVGSPKTGQVYAVLVNNGVGQSKDYGKVVLKAAEWKKVPDVSAWKIDSDVALADALKIYPQGKTSAYSAGFVTFVPSSAPKTAVKAMTWNINFDPASKGKAPTSTVLVDMVTGATSFAK